MYEESQACLPPAAKTNKCSNIWVQFIKNCPDHLKYIRIDGNTATLTNGRIFIKGSYNARPGYYKLNGNTLERTHIRELTYPDPIIAVELYERAKDYYEDVNGGTFYGFLIRESDQKIRDRMNYERRRYEQEVEDFRRGGPDPVPPVIRSTEYLKDVLEFLKFCSNRNGSVVVSHDRLHLEQWPSEFFSYPRGLGVKGPPIVFDSDDLLMAFKEAEEWDINFHLFHNAEDPLSPWFFAADYNNFTCVYPERVLING